MGYLFFHGWLLVTGPAADLAEHPLIAREEAFYRETDSWGYLRYLQITRTYHIAILSPDNASPWFVALPDFVQGSAMFVWDTPTVWVNNWNQQEIDPGMTMSTVEHELFHVLWRWHPDYLVRIEGISPYALDMNDWHTWLGEEVCASNIQYRVARRLGSKAGMQYALDVAHVEFGAMSDEQQERFLAQYGGWLEKEVAAQQRAVTPAEQ